MHCLKNIDRIDYPVDLVMNLTKLYKFKGKDFYYADVFKNEMKKIVSTTIEKDAFYAGKILELNISESRSRAILKKDALPKSNDEKILYNLKNIFKLTLESQTGIDLTSNDFLQMAKKIFDGVKKISFDFTIKDVRINLLTESKKVSKREDLEKMIGLYSSAKLNKKAETTQLITNFYVDFTHMNIYNEENDFIGLLNLYCLILKEGFYVFRYQSFFEAYYKRKDEFKTALAEGSYNWEEGFSKTSTLNSLIITMMLEGYEKVENELKNKVFDKNLKKIENIETVILKMGEIFTREEVKNKMPHVSDSTINRALKQLKDENKIRPNGTGRSATWINLAKDTEVGSKIRQMNIGDFMNMNDEED